MKVNMTQKEYNNFLSTASAEIEKEIKSLLPEESSFHIFHVYRDAGKRSGYKKYFEISFPNIRGITFLILKHKGVNHVYTAHCHNEDTYSKSFGRKEVLSKLNKDVQSKFKSDHTDFKVGVIPKVDQKQQENAIINFKTSLNWYAKALEFRPPCRTLMSGSQLIDSLGGVPLLLEEGWVFVEEDGSIKTVKPFEKDCFDRITHWDRCWKKNLVSLIDEVMEKDLSLQAFELA